MATKKLIILLSLLHIVFGKGSESLIECTPEYIKVSVPMDGDRRVTYLNQMKDFTPCLPTTAGNMATYMLDLQDYHRCGVMRVINNMNGKRTFYHKIVIETSTGDREVVPIACVVTHDLRVISKRAVEPFPLDFNEPEVLTITRYEESHAPDPMLGAVVKQNGKVVSGEISVSPGTPLSMEISLDKNSSSVYGLLVNYMHVTDTGEQHETIIFNGCSIDTYLFDNFVTTDGDVLTAKFRAFKFPDTTYVQFKGTVTVCLDKCQGVQCSNGAVGYGRRRRAIASSHVNKVYEVSLSTLIKVENLNGDKEAEDILALLHNKNLNIANQMLDNKGDTVAIVAERTDTVRTIQDRPAKSSSVAFTSSLLVMSSLFLNLFY